MTVSLTADKKTQLYKLCSHVLKGGPLSIHSIASLIGKLIAVLPRIEFGRLYYRRLERDKIKALALNNGDFHASISLSHCAVQDIQ